jgi:hypothetical protein
MPAPISVGRQYARNFDGITPSLASSSVTSLRRNVPAITTRRQPLNDRNSASDEYHFHSRPADAAHHYISADTASPTSLRIFARFDLSLIDYFITSLRRFAKCLLRVLPLRHHVISLIYMVSKATSSWRR